MAQVKHREFTGLVYKLTTNIKSFESINVSEEFTLSFITRSDILEFLS